MAQARIIDFSKERDVERITKTLRAMPAESVSLIADLLSLSQLNPDRTYGRLHFGPSNDTELHVAVH